ncbi:pentapeptide repeat-containing protein [Flavobacterium sp. SUN046]|uniref:pentapeptide repeat-containing protein n=1 Tax=Flavobacterium sp. SUN046 TaxID=3002440 RepID=UPI002DB8E57B|nr:pentapeptide repeat-containing protein [Flavobacterium sp. SUN046]MEC4049120.1 pentapeptide repeat-containing protein [Flavobacterium sp. SUN046]
MKKKATNKVVNSCCLENEDTFITIKEIVKEVLNEKEQKRKNDLEETFKEHGENLNTSSRVEKKDKMFYSSKTDKIENIQYFVLDGNNFQNHLFVRAIARKMIFKNVDFSKTYFENCYLRDCRFIRCNFEGAKFTGSNLIGSYFKDCNFDYVTFEKTFVDDEIFQCAPKRDNLRYKFARSLKLNYASIGDYIKASKAVTIELEATKSHLKDSWLSGEEWYKLKYGGIKRRFEQFRKWVAVSLLDFVWGNGESLWRLIRFNLIIFSILTLFHIFSKSVTDVYKILDIFIIKIPSNYFGIVVKGTDNNNYFDYYPAWLNLTLVITRLICFGLLMSIIIKKYNRR